MSILFWIVIVFSIGSSPIAIASDTQPKPVDVDDWITPDDYPEEVEDKYDEGIVQYSLKIDKLGYPTSCEVEGSSGNETLDSRTCELLLERASFNPLADAKSERKFQGHVIWKMPPQVLRKSFLEGRIGVLDQFKKPFKCTGFRKSVNDLQQTDWDCLAEKGMERAIKWMESSFGNKSATWFSSMETVFYDKGVNWENRDADKWDYLLVGRAKFLVDSDGSVSNCEFLDWSGPKRLRNSQFCSNFFGPYKPGEKTNAEGTVRIGVPIAR